MFFFFMFFQVKKQKVTNACSHFTGKHEKNTNIKAAEEPVGCGCDGVAGAPGQDSLADLWLTDGAGGGWELSRRDSFMSASPHSAHFQSEVAKPLA